MASEGEHNPYTNLILAGWDHYTKDAKSALFKVRCLHMVVTIGALIASVFVSSSEKLCVTR